MECRSCYEVFDESRIPRNLPCGHTYCEICLDQVYLIKKRLECPDCRFKVDHHIKPAALSKNFIAYEIASKHRELQKKLLFCSEHKEPLRFFCESCQENICPSCILDHNGHKFVKQDHSVSLLTQRGKDLKTKLSSKLQELKAQKAYEEECLKDLNKYCEQELKHIDNEFEMLISHLIDRKACFKQEYQEMCQNEMASLDSEVMKVEEFIRNMNKNIEEINNYVTKLDNVKVIQGNDFEKQLGNLEEMVEKDLKIISKEASDISPSLPKVVFDNAVYKEIQNFGITSKDVQKPKILYFGEKSKILVYSVEHNEWEVILLPYGETFEFNYYSSAVTLPNGSVIITGGGLSNTVCQLEFCYPQNSKTCQPKVIEREPMFQARKEHASVYLQNGVYVLGGYNGLSNTFLNSCERYDLETNQWSQISKMQVPKCAFGATTLANRYIFTMGGYDGTNRLSIIEKYDIQTNKWAVLNVQMKEPLSNCACFAYSDHYIMTLGGGHNVGFSLEMNQLNVDTLEWKQFPPMAYGKDLRNKVVIFNGDVYAIGGNNCVAEKYSLRKNEWSLVSSYHRLINDNLDSWACAFSYVTKKTPEVQFPPLAEHFKMPPRSMNYQFYSYDPRSGDENENENGFDTYSCSGSENENSG